MSQRYADIIIDISQTNVDKPFVYKVPDEISDAIRVGDMVKVPFGQGNRLRNGYVIGFSEKPDFDVSKIKEIKEISGNALSIESKLIYLAQWIKERYGCTMITALRTVMPVKEKIRYRASGVDIREFIPTFQPIEKMEPQQQQVVDDFTADLDAGKHGTYLLHGVTGSGKTEVYIKMAEEVINRGRDVIVLVPEIALTYQTVARFSSYFQDRVAILNSQLSKGEKYREFMRARDGETHIMIGPRSALFAPFPNLGLIIIDEEHDISYKSDMTPKYHAREVAIERARLDGASVVLGSATPSIRSFYKARNNEYKLYSMKERVRGSVLPEVSVVDLREELRMGNRSIISQELYERLDEAFKNGQQAMLFINRRGFNSFVSCRSCGEVIKCPNCDVSLALHGKNRLMCHYCGHTEALPEECPKCKSKLIGGYGTGTEKLEAEIKRIFPNVRTLRMDRDTTARKGANGEIIRRFREGEADCLVGTQMIVKGHDFPNVTVVGNILADLSLFDGDYESAERTFDLLTQAAGRAGRGDMKGYVVIQTYQPEHYAIECAAKQDYEGFYEYEIAYRKILRFPPAYNMLAIRISAEEEILAVSIAQNLADSIREYGKSNGLGLDVVGPAEAVIYKVNNVFRRMIYIKADDYQKLRNVTELCDRIADGYQNNRQTESDDCQNNCQTVSDDYKNNRQTESDAENSGRVGVGAPERVDVRTHGISDVRDKELSFDIQYDFNPMRIM